MRRYGRIIGLAPRMERVSEAVLFTRQRNIDLYRLIKIKRQLSFKLHYSFVASIPTVVRELY